MTSTDPIRVALLVPHGGMSGAEINIAFLLRHLPRNQFELHLIAPADQPLMQIAKDNGGIVHETRFPQFFSTSIETKYFRIFNPFATLIDLLLVLQLSIRLARLAGKYQIQVLYTASMMAHLTGALAHLWRPRTRVVIHMQDIIAPRLARGVGRHFFGLVARLADRVIVVSKSVQESLTVKHNVALVYNGADLGAYQSVTKSTLREELHVGAATSILGIVGRLTPWKGHKIFLEAASTLAHAGADCHFVVIGDDRDPTSGQSHYRSELESYARSLGLDGNVTFTGQRNDMPNVMRGLDILIVPSLRPDPFPLVPLEGMASGKPVIGSSTGGIAEIIIDNVTGRLFEPGDVDKLTACMRQLIDDPQLRSDFGQIGQKRIEQHFTLDRFVSSIADIFRQAAR